MLVMVGNSKRDEYALCAASPCEGAGLRWIAAAGRRQPWSIPLGRAYVDWLDRAKGDEGSPLFAKGGLHDHAAWIRYFLGVVHPEVIFTILLEPALVRRLADEPAYNLASRRRLEVAGLHFTGPYDGVWGADRARAPADCDWGVIVPGLMEMTHF